MVRPCGARGFHTVRDNRVDSEVHKGRMQTGRRTAHAGSRLKLPTIQEGTAWKANLPAVLGKTRRTLRQDKSRKGEQECDLKPFIAIQRVQLPPGRGEPASRKQALHGWWQHHS